MILHHAVHWWVYVETLLSNEDQSAAPLHKTNVTISLSHGLNCVSTDTDSHAGPHHKDSTSGVESCCHTCPTCFCPVTTPTYSGNGNHIYHQTRITERPHQPAGGQQADKPELGARATGIQERYGGKSSISSVSCWLSMCPVRLL